MDMEASDSEIKKVNSSSEDKTSSSSTYDPQLCRHIHPLCVFTKWPKIVITVEDLEEMVFARVLLYHALERVTLRNSGKISKEFISLLRFEVVNLGTNTKSKKVRKAIEKIFVLIDEQKPMDKLKEAIKHETCSHFLLRILYCRSEMLQKYFISRELEWFQAKWLMLELPEITAFLKNCGFLNEEKPICESLKMSLQAKLIGSTAVVTENNLAETDFYKLDWFMFGPLIGSKSLYLEQGKAYVPTMQLYPYFQYQLKNTLEVALKHAYQVIIDQHIIPDDRIAYFCEKLDGYLTEKQYYASKSQGLVDGQKIDDAAAAHFPLCMQHFHERLRENHHLKHMERFTYGLFLKAIGLRYEDTEKLWREEFTKQMDEDRFEKDYGYYIKYLYGLVGAEKNYEPRSCEQLIRSQEQYSQCPFKMYDSQMLLNKCLKKGFSQQDIQEVIDYMENEEYQLACLKYFQMNNNKSPMNMILHPVQYYQESCQKDDEPFCVDIEDLCSPYY